MSDRPRGEGWWLASDGKWYPPETRPAETPGPGPDWWLASDGNWYPPETRPGATLPPGPGWWLASDGNWYPPETRPAETPYTPTPAAPPGDSPRAAPQAPLYGSSPPAAEREGYGSAEAAGVEGAYAAAPRISAGTSTALRFFLYGAALLAALASLLTFNEVGRFEAFLDGGSRSALVDAEDASATAITWFSIIILATGVLFLAWMRQAYKAIAALGATGRRWSPGWAIGAWFVPVANFVLPKLVINEIDRVSNPANGPPPIEERWRGADVLTVGSFWWGFWLLGGVVIFIGSVVSGAELERELFDPDRYQGGLIMRGVGYGIQIVSALLGARVVKAIGSRLDPVKQPAAPSPIA